MIIAIDGTSASGKGTIAKRLAAHFGLPHMDTGKLYRAAGLATLRAGVDFEDTNSLGLIARETQPHHFTDTELKSAETAQAASRVARVPEVRKALFDLQRDFANQRGGAILDGRDIGTVIAPDADVKLWVTASLEERAKRRLKELHGEGNMIGLEDLIADLTARDERDAARRDAPAIMAVDAVLLDTTHLSIDAAVDKAIAVVETARAKKKS